MKTILAALFAVLIGLTFVGSTFAAEGSKMGAPAAPTVASGEMKKKEEGQHVAKASKKRHSKKQHEEKKEEKK